MNPWLSQVNQKLFFARVLLEQYGLKEDRHGHIELVLCQAVVYQLECAYRHHLREVAATYKSAAPEVIDSVERLVVELTGIGKHPAEAQEMMDLEQDVGSWLQQMLSVWQSFHQLPRLEAEADTNSPIPVMQVAEASQRVLAELNISQVTSWLDALQELVNRHRELMVEC
ncbi:MAG: DUF6586 family protein [Porticoccaceae bacterium]|nr:hypothetical protein [Pseudomonadales bacterium]MCP5171536.1 hypothetical protein [Pseudomonadales bacterium]